MENSLSDVELIALIKCQNEEAYNFLFFRYDDKKAIIVNPLFHRFKNLGVEYDDLVSYSKISLDYAIRTYDESQGSFFNYWYNISLRQLYTYVRQYFAKKKHNIITLSELDNDQYVIECKLKDNSPSISENISTYEMIEDINHIRNDYLSKEDNMILEMVIDGYSYKDIASYFSLPLKTVDNRLYQIRKIIKKKLLTKYSA